MTAPRDIVIVGASLAGLRAAEALRDGGFDGRLTLIGDEAHPPYDRPPLSKQVLSGWVAPMETALPRQRSIDAVWRLGAAATRLDRTARQVETADGRRFAYDRLVIATGTRARPWPVADQTTLTGVHVLRTLEDAGRLLADLAAAPSRVLIIGAGFTGCEVASACRDRGLAVTVIEPNPTPLLNALGAVVGGHAADLQRRAGVDLRCGVSVTDLLDDGGGRVDGARLSDGAVVEASVVVACLGAQRNWEWLAGANLDAGPLGCLCDSGCRVLQADGSPADEIFVCGDIARFHHPLAGERPVSLEHWGNAVDQAGIVAANILKPGSASNDGCLPRFWSMQFGSNIKASGLPSAGDQMMVVQGDIATGRFVAAFGRGGRIVGVVSVNQAQWLDFYEQQIAAGAPFPPTWRGVDAPADAAPRSAGFASLSQTPEVSALDAMA